MVQYKNGTTKSLQAKNVVEGGTENKNVGNLHFYM